MKITRQTVYKVEMSREEMHAALKQWRSKPETKAMMAKEAAERKSWVRNLVAEIDAQKKR
ncbi:hypothetical protein HDR61_00660 [bacterium]|nr:hypothetical protein [bacterium]